MTAVGDPATQVTVTRIRLTTYLKTIAAVSAGPALTRSTWYGSFGAHETSLAWPVPSQPASTAPPGVMNVRTPAIGSGDAGSVDGVGSTSDDGNSTTPAGSGAEAPALGASDGFLARSGATAWGRATEIVPTDGTPVADRAGIDGSPAGAAPAASPAPLDGNNPASGTTPATTAATAPPTSSRRRDPP
ncbi:hypothetical protein AB0F10_32530, partial [Actinoplanes sp. NPDC026623]